MSTEVIYEQSLLARLSYLSWNTNAFQLVAPTLRDEAIVENIGRVAAQLGSMEGAETISQSWSPVAAFDSAQDEGSTGLQATVFRNNQSGAYTVAVRGTAGTLDLVQDVFLAAGLPANATAQFNALTDWLDQLSAAGGPLDGKQVNFTGHSLGGYLAAAAHTHYQSTGSMSVGTSYLFNAPGIGGAIGSVAEFFQDVLGIDEPSGAGIVNVESSEGLRVTSALGVEPSPVVIAQIQESTNPLTWHGIAPLSNTLLAAATFESAIGLSLTDYNRVVDSFPGGIGGAIEYLGRAAALGGVVVDGTWASIYEASAVISSHSGNLSGYSMLSENWDSLAMEDSLAGAAVRDALQTLSPIAIPSTLVAEVPNDRTPLYWQQRTEMLQRLAWFNEHDINPYTTDTPTTPDGSGAGLSAYQTDATIFRDGARGITIQQGPDTQSMSRTIFGSTGVSSEIVGGGVGDFLFSSGRTETLRGEYGSDYLEGYGGGDQLIGGQGDDVLVGLTSADGRGYHFDGGTENDTISGSANGDTYTYRAGDGHDTIQEALDATGANDSIRLQGVSVATTTFSLSGSNLFINMADGGSVEVVGWGATGGDRGRIETLTFDDATLTADTVDAILAGSIVGTEGDNTLAVPAGANGMPVFGLGGADRLYGSNTASSWLYGGAGVDRLYAGTQGDFLDGGADGDYLYGSANQDTLLGGSGADYISGGGNAGAMGDYFEGGAGGDQLIGTLGADTYVVNVGDGMDYLTESSNTTATDTLELGGAAGTVSRSGTSLVIRNSNGDGVTVANWYTTAGSTANQIEQVTGAFNLTAAELTAMGLVVQGSDTNGAARETLSGLTGFYNEIHGNGGYDWIVGGNQGNLLDGGADNDYLTGGTGFDQMYGGSGNDQLVGQVNTDGSGDYYEGGAGGDSLSGTVGADTYVVNVGDGMDYLTESSNTTAVDTLELGGAGGTATRSGNSLILQNSTGDGVTISNWFPSSGASTAYQVEVLHIGGATYTNAQINALDFTNGPVTLSGSATAAANAEALYAPQSASEPTDAQGLELFGDTQVAPLSATVDTTATEESAMLTEQMEASSDVGTAPETTITVDDDTSATTTVETPVYLPQEPQNFSLATV